MRTRRVVVAVALVAVAIARPRADLRATPEWRLADGITTALPIGDTVYVGGTFSRLFTPATSENQFYDLATGQPRVECARSTSTERALSGYPDGRGGLLVPLQPGDTLADDGGAFAPAATTTIVRINEACRWDRQFEAEAIDPSTPSDLTIGVPARVGGLVLASNAVVGPDLFLRAQVASFDAGTGRRVNYQFYLGKSEIGILGATTTRVIVRVRNGPVDPYVLGALDPVTLALTESTSTLTDETSSTRSWIRGDTLYRLRAVPFNLLEAYDLTTLQAKTGWTPPFVPGLVDLDVAGTRVFVTARTVNGQTVPSPAALLASSGAIDTSWTPPALSRREPDPNGQPYVPTLTALATDGTRLYFSGDFERVGGVDRDGVAALGVAGAGLDTWDPAPLLIAPLETTPAALLATRPTGANRTDRRYLAAINRATGRPTDWNPNNAAIVLQHTPTPVAALAADGVHVYFASATSGEVLRALRTTGEVDQTWRVTLRRTLGTPGAVLAMQMAGGVLYLGGEFDRISGTNFAATARRALAAVGADGRLLPWAPALGGPDGSTLLRSMLVDGPTVYLGGDFLTVNDLFRQGYAAVDATSGGLAQPEMFVLGETSVYGLATDGVQTYVAGVSYGSPLVGAVSVPGAQLTPFGPTGGVPPISAAFVAGRLYAGLEYDVEAGTPTARTTRWNRVIADDQGLVHVLADGTIDYYQAIAGNRPGPPVLTGTSSGNTVSLSWTPSAGGAPTFYTVRAGSAPGTTELASIRLRNVTSFSATAPSRLYYITVVAENIFGASAPSNEVAVQAGCVTAPPTPGPLTFTTAGTTVALSWGAAATTVSYSLEAGQTPGSSSIGTIPLGLRTAFSASAPLGTYYVRVRAANDCGVSPPSNEVVITLDGTTSVPSAPTALAAAVAGRTVTFTWTPPTSGGTPASYVIEAGTTPGGIIAILPTTAPGLVVPSAPTGTFYVRVRAVNAAGSSAPTPDLVVTIPGT